MTELKDKSIIELRADIEKLRKDYTEWKSEHPDQQNEQVINKFLLIKAELKKRKKPLGSKDTDLDIEAKMLSEIAKIKTIPIIPTEHTFGDNTFGGDAFSIFGSLDRPHKCKYCDEPATLAIIWAEGRAFIPVCEKHKVKAIYQVEKVNHDEVEVIRKLPTKVVVTQAAEKGVVEKEVVEKDYAPVGSSGKELGTKIQLKDIEPHLKSFAISDPVSWIVGGLITHPEGTKNDVDILVSLPTEKELQRIIEFRLYRMLPEKLQKRIQLLMEEKGGLSPFTDYLPLYRLVMERIPDAKIVKMEELESNGLESDESEDGKLDINAEIKLRTKGTEKQQAEANKAAKEDKITFGEFFKPQKPKRGFFPGQAQTLDSFLSIWKDEQFPVYSSRKADGMNTEWHISRDGKVIVYTEDGVDETSSFPQSIEEAKKLSPGHDLILLAEAEWWEDGQHYPREVANGNIHKTEPNEAGIIINVYDMVYFDNDIHGKPFGDRWELLEKVNFPQKTEFPDPKYNWNLIPHIENKDKEALKKETERLRKIKGSEGNVAKQGSAGHDLKGRRENTWVKFHNSTTFIAIVLNSVETKTKGVYNLEYGILAGKRPTEEKDTQVIDGKEVISVGKSFSTKENPAEGSGILIEAETINVTYDSRSKTFDLSAWAPRMLGATDKKFQTMEEVEKQAIKDHVFQAKIIDKDGKMHYLPGKSGEEVMSK